MKKTRILVMSDSYKIYTGFGNVARHVTNYLHKSGSYEIGYLGWFDNDMNNLIPPFTYYTTIKDHSRCCKRPHCVMKQVPDKEVEYFESKEGILIPIPGGPQCRGGVTTEQDKYAFGSMHGVILDFKPDIIWTLGDTWMTFHTQFMDIRKCYRWVLYTPIDGKPMPHILEEGPQPINWPETIARADQSVAFCDFGRDTMIATGDKVGIDLHGVKVIYHGNDNDNFKPVPEKRQEYRKKWLKITDPNIFTIGIFSRNQPRKAFHKLFEALALGKEKGYWDGTKIKCYCHCPIKDVGWNLPGLIKWHGIEDIVLLNKDLKVGTGPTYAEMNELYNACDLMTLPSRGEGWGLTYSEAMGAGTPTLMSDYSAHNDWAKGGAARIKTIALDAEPKTNIERAIVDIDDYCEKIKAFYDNVSMLVYQDHFGIMQGYNTEFPVTGDDNLSKSVREYFSEQGRKLCEEYLGWDNVCKQWDTLFDGLVLRDLQQYPQFKIPQTRNLTDFLDRDKKDRILYVMPGTFGDVFLSTAVIDGVKKKFPDKDIYFATKPQFKDILKDNPNVHKILDYTDLFMNYVQMNQLFELTLHPNVLTQVHGNWTRNGAGKHLLDVYADYCEVEVGDRYIKLDKPPRELPEEFIVVHTKTGQGAKDYATYNQLCKRIDMTIVQVGSPSDPAIKGAVDMRGKSINETAYIINECALFIGGDSIPAHIAGYLDINMIQIFGGTFAHLVDPTYKTTRLNTYVAVEPEDRYGCDKPCHQIECYRQKNGSCANTITIDDILVAFTEIMGEGKTKEPEPVTLSGYTTLYNPEGRYPWRECIKSMLGFCDEVIVLDGGSEDGTYDELKKWRKEEPRIKLHKRRWKDDEPAMDGRQKAFARALCNKEFLWQQDADEIVHEDDYEKVKKIAGAMPESLMIMHLPVIDLYGNEKTVKADTGLNKWRLTRNHPNITHGIHKAARKTNKAGKLYADKNISDGCEYIYADSFDIVKEQSTYMDQPLVQSQADDHDKYAKSMRAHFNNLPSVWHFSWADLDRRVRVNLDFWNKQWAHLDSGDEKAEQNPMFPGKKSSEITDDEIHAKAIQLFTTKEDGKAVQTFQYTDRKPPKLAEAWLKQAFLQGDTEYIKPMGLMPSDFKTEEVGP